MYILPCSLLLLLFKSENFESFLGKLGVDLDWLAMTIDKIWADMVIGETRQSSLTWKSLPCQILERREGDDVLSFVTWVSANLCRAHATARDNGFSGFYLSQQFAQCIWCRQWQLIRLAVPSLNYTAAVAGHTVSWVRVCRQKSSPFALIGLENFRIVSLAIQSQ